MTFTLAIVGRPNVGKSTLFNRLTGKHLAITDDQPGITRDWRKAPAQLYGREFTVIDTAGLEEFFDDSMKGKMRKATESALKETDVILFMIDGREGLTAADRNFANFLRKQGKPILVAVNKSENLKAVANGLAESHSLGFGDPIPLSAAHSEGMEELFHYLQPYFPEQATLAEEKLAEDEDFGDLDAIEGDETFEFKQEEDSETKAVKIAIVGRPNVGKSTLLNAILEDERVITSPEAGTTRDAVTVDWVYQDRPFKLVDTAGIRKKARVIDEIEKLSVEDSLRAIRLAQIVILVIDGNVTLEKQDLQIADHVIQEGRVLIIAVNKWDEVDNKAKNLQTLKDRMDASLGQIRDIPYVTISALNGKNIDTLLVTTLKTYAIWNRRVPTSNLNRWLKRMEARNPAPLVNGRPNRLKYITQIKTRPPTFALWVSKAGDMPEPYKRYIINGLREECSLPGIPVRLLIRSSKNPYVD
jgi:GTP-binding protein